MWYGPTYRVLALAIALLVCVTMGSIAYSAENKQNVLADYTHSIGDSDALAARDIAQVAKFYGTSDTSFYFQNRLKRLRKAGPEALPALNALLNRDIWEGNLTDNKQVIDSLRGPATKVWYNIRWMKASREQRIATAVMSLDSRAEVDLVPSVGVKKIMKLGKAARPAVYRLLMSNAQYNPNALNVRRVSFLIKLLKLTAFSPTDPEMSQVLQKGGEYGRFAMISYMAYESHYTAQWFLAFTHWMKSQKPEKERHYLLDRVESGGHRGSVPPAAMAHKIADLALDMAERSVTKLRQDKAQNTWDYYMPSLAAVYVYDYSRKVDMHEQMVRLKQLHQSLADVVAQAKRDDILEHVDHYKSVWRTVKNVAGWIRQYETRK